MLKGKFQLEVGMAFFEYPPWWSRCLVFFNVKKMGTKALRLQNLLLVQTYSDISTLTRCQSILNVAKSFQDQFQPKVTSRSQFEITSGRPGAEWVVEQNGTSHLCISLKFNVDSIWKIFYTKFDKSYKGDKSYAVAHIGLPVSAIFPCSFVTMIWHNIDSDGVIKDNQ